jgi:hypothetical protein
MTELHWIRLQSCTLTVQVAGLDVEPLSYIIKIKLSRNSRKGDVMDPEIHSNVRFARVLYNELKKKKVDKAKIHITGPTKRNVLGTKSYSSAISVPKKGEIRGDITPVTVT